MSSKSASEIQARIEDEIRAGDWLPDSEAQVLLDLFRLLGEFPPPEDRDVEYSPFVYPH